MSTDCNPIEQQQRQHYLEQLYLLDGRDNPQHPLHALYTGLAEQRRQALVAADRDALVGLACTADSDDTPLHLLLGSYIGPGLITDADAAAAVAAAWCRILASRLSYAVRRLDPPGTERATFATQSVLAIVDWLRHEAVRAELNEQPLDLAPASVEPVGV